MLFIARAEPESDATQLVSLRCSLNSKVVSIPGLPLRPARMGFWFDEEFCTDPGNKKGVRNETAPQIWRELAGAEPGSTGPEGSRESSRL